MKNNLNQIKSKALPILKQAGVKRSAIFGSYVRGDTKLNSDVDFLIDLPEEKSLLEFVDLKLKLQDALKKEVDLVEYERINPTIKKKILQERVPI